jgi:3-(3-hydroxy-phenyl)propionate hydroxylase
MTDVLVVGAGPVGLATALSLAHQGVSVKVIEAEPRLTEDHRAGSFHPPTLEMLAPFGVTEAMHRIGIKVPRWQIRDRREGVSSPTRRRSRTASTSSSTSSRRSCWRS